MNSTYSDKLKAAGTLTGSSFNDDGSPRRWSAIYAHEDSEVLLTSDSMTVGDGIVKMSEESTIIPAGSTFFCNASIIEWVFGEVTCYRAKAL